MSATRDELVTLIDTNTTLAVGARAAGDYDNTPGVNDRADFYLHVEYDGTLPTAGNEVATLYVLRSDRNGVFAEGGDGTRGSNFNPEAHWAVGTFKSVNPNASTREVLSLADIPLGPYLNRVVVAPLVATFGSTWELRMQTISEA